MNTVFTMSGAGGVIAGNTAGVKESGSYGGGVYLNTSSLLKTGNSIIYGVNGGTNANIVKDGGSGQYTDHGSAVYYSGAKRMENTAGSDMDLDYHP
jgi:hypothetical protein